MTLDADFLFKNIPTDNPVIVAVSGGSDSIALLVLANIWALKHDVTLQAVTVDHGLRPEAAAEAAFVSGVCAGLGVPHVTLAWEGLKPSFGIQEAARQSRYSLMDDFAHEIGADVILTGHTRDDQAETILMRCLRQSPSGDGRGLSGMSQNTWLYGGCSIYRPLLCTDRKMLRDFLTGMTQSWVEDPSNHDTSYERVRLRKYLGDNPVVGEKLISFGDVCGRLRKALSKDVAGLLVENVTVAPGPVYRFQTPVTRHGKKSGACLPVNDPVVSHTVQALIAIAGGQPHFVPRHKLASVFALLEPDGLSHLDGSSKRVTLGGAIIELKDDALLFYREARNQSSLLLEPGEAAIWDGRMHLYNGTPMPVFVEVASRQQIKSFEEMRGEPFPVKPRNVLRSTPVLHFQTSKGGTTPCLPLIETTELPKGMEVRLASPAIEHFCPEFDAPVRDWVRSLDRYTAASLQP